MKRTAQTVMGWSLVLASLWTGTAMAASTCAPKGIYLMRHAEKLVEAGNRDPQLSAAGHQRARALVDKLRGITVDRIYATPYQRTQQTVAPLAADRQLKTIITDPRAPATLVEELQQACDQVLVYAGHSNTVPALLRALGITIEVTFNGQSLPIAPHVFLDEQDFGGLFEVRYATDGSPTLILDRF